MRVLDLTRVLAGPYATMLLAELGADVVKVEQPGVGDDTRGWAPPYAEGESAYFRALNSGKRSVELDLSTSEGRQVVDSLLEGTDVLVENFRPGVAERLGLDADRVAEKFPHVVYASITGFGSTGPWATRAGTEVIVEAQSGLMNITGETSEEPVRFGVAMVDLATGLSATTGLLAALLERTRTGRGRRIEVSLYATALSTLGTVIAAESAGGGPARAWGSAHPSIVPYRAFRCSDGHVVVGATNDAMFARLAASLAGVGLSRPAWRTNSSRVDDRAGVEAAVAEAVRDRATADVTSTLEAAGVLVGPVLTVAEAAGSEQSHALGLMDEVGGIQLTRSPLAPNGTRRLGRAPRLGEHTDEVLEEIRPSTTRVGQR